MMEETCGTFAQESARSSKADNVFKLMGLLEVHLVFAEISLYLNMHVAAVVTIL